ncbi:hypothetical protein D3C78_1814680 [compost metagenome]
MLAGDLLVDLLAADMSAVDALAADLLAALKTYHNFHKSVLSYLHAVRMKNNTLLPNNIPLSPANMFLHLPIHGPYKQVSIRYKSLLAIVTFYYKVE